MVAESRSGDVGSKSGVGLARRLAQIVSLGLLIALAGCYWWRVAGTAIITVLPAWLWAAPGVLLGVAARGRNRGGRTALLLAGWMAFLLMFCEEPWALVTRWWTWPDPAWQAARTAGKGFRVITFNCGDGGPEAVREALAYSPDILVLQESPAEADLREELSEYSDLQLLYGFDVSIVARGQVVPAAASQARWMFNAAHVTLDGVRIAVVGLRLRVPSFSLAVWSPHEWRLAAASQRDQAAELRYVLEQVEPLDRSVPMVLAGDFNAPAGDAIFRVLPETMHDAFRESGIGLGNTMMNDFPVSRIDQIWLDSRLMATATITRKTSTSDHRLVIADVVLP